MSLSGSFTDIPSEKLFIYFTYFILILILTEIGSMLPLLARQIRAYLEIKRVMEKQVYSF